MQLAELDKLLERTPVMLQAHPALLAYLSPDIQVLPTASALLRVLDTPEPLPIAPMVTFDVQSHHRSRLPIAYCALDPYTDALNAVLSTRYATIAAHTLTQQHIADEIVKMSCDCEVILLLLIDGLAYRDVRDWPDQIEHPSALLPCLATGPTITRFCFPTIIGNPPLAARLFDQGFSVRLGVSYWSRADNELTNRLFATIHDMQRCISMKDTIEYVGHSLQKHCRERIYIQIIRVGLDADAHHNRELPPITGMLHQILMEINILARLLERTKKRSRLFVTSDHGILWRHEFTPDVIGHAQGNARMAHWRDLVHQSKPGMRFIVADEVYHALPYPLLRRPLRSDEAGLHGGISFQESIVPFLAVEVNVC